MTFLLRLCETPRKQPYWQELATDSRDVYHWLNFNQFTDNDDFAASVTQLNKLSRVIHRICGHFSEDKQRHLTDHTALTAGLVALSSGLYSHSRQNSRTMLKGLSLVNVPMACIWNRHHLTGGNLARFRLRLGEVI